MAAYILIWYVSASLAPRPQAVFQQVEFRQANLANPASCEKVFADEEGPFDIVYNLAAETKYGQADQVGDGGCMYIIKAKLYCHGYLLSEAHWSVVCGVVCQYIPIVEW